MKKKTNLFMVFCFTVLFTWYAYSVFFYMLGPDRILACVLPLIFCSLGFFFSFLLIVQKKQLVGVVLLMFICFYLHTVRFGYHRFNPLAPKANYKTIVISSNNTERMNIFNFHFSNYDVLDATKIKIPDEWKTTSAFLNRCLNLYFSYVTIFKKEYDTDWILVLEDDAIPLEKSLFKKQINSVIAQYYDKDYICLDVRSNLLQGLTGQILGSSAGSIFKVSSLFFISEEVLKFKTWKQDRYIDKVLVNLCYRKRLNCIAVPLIQENGLPSLLNGN